MSEEVERRFEELGDLAEQYAKAQSVAEHLSEYRKSKKAMLMKEAEITGSKTAAEQEREAYRHREYIELLEGLRDATAQALSLKWKLTIAQMRFDMWRTDYVGLRSALVDLEHILRDPALSRESRYRLRW